MTGKVGYKSVIRWWFRNVDYAKLASFPDFQLNSFGMKLEALGTRLMRNNVQL